MTIEAIASAIYNHVVTGLAGINANPKISIEQLQDEVVAERNIILREYLLKGVLKFDDQYLSLDCIPVTCDSMSKCCEESYGQHALHFEIPPVLHIHGGDTIKFIGSVDRKHQYKVYTDESYKYHQYKKRGGHKPYIYIDYSINRNGNLDGYIFNAPLIQNLCVVALFQDPRQLLNWNCCTTTPEVYLECGALSDEIIKRLTEKYIRWYKSAATPAGINNQIPR